jgi:hypothetical protein
MSFKVKLLKESSFTGMSFLNDEIDEYVDAKLVLII